MVNKILAWASLGFAVLFAIVAATVYAMGYKTPADPSQATLKAFLISSPLIVSILLALALLVWSAFGSDS